MTNDFLKFFLSSAAVAGVAVIWRNWITDHPNFKQWIENALGPLKRTLLCGSCFTYWLALAFTITAEPISYWMPFAPSAVGLVADVFARWMALSWSSVFLRFLYVALQELVHYQVHHLKDDHRH
jgi:hypothetical protein